MVVSRLGLRPSRSQIEAVDKLARANTVEEVRSLLGMESYLRKFVRGYISLVAPVSDFLRDKRFTSNRARRLPVLWGAEQDKALKALVEFLTSPPIMALPDGDGRPRAGRWSCTHAGHQGTRTRYRVYEPPLVKDGCQAVRD